MYYKYIGPDPFQSPPFKDGNIVSSIKQKNQFQPREQSNTIYQKLEDLLTTTTTTTTNNESGTGVSNSNSITDTSYNKNNDSLFREHNFVVKQLNEDEEHILMDKNYNNHFQMSQYPQMSQIPHLDDSLINNNSDNKNSKTRSSSSESLPLAPPHQPIPPLTIQIPLFNVSEEREKMINRLKDQDEKINRENDQEWHQDSSTGIKIHLKLKLE